MLSIECPCRSSTLQMRRWRVGCTIQPTSCCKACQALPARASAASHASTLSCKICSKRYLSHVPFGISSMQCYQSSTFPYQSSTFPYQSSTFPYQFSGVLSLMPAPASAGQSVQCTVKVSLIPTHQLSHVTDGRVSYAYVRL